MRRRYLQLASLIWCLASWALSLGAAEGSHPGDQREARGSLLPDDRPNPGDFLELPNLLKVSESVYCGGEPVNSAAFENLARLGIKTVVSVDGALPRVEEARRNGLKYVHIPFGYDGVSTNARLSLTRLAREGEGPLYIHCHHGQHRGPTAAAVVCIASGLTDGNAAVEILRRGGTGTNYAGLWRDVASFVPPGPDVPLPELVEVATVDSLAGAMAKIDRSWDNLLLCQEVGWKIPAEHPDLAPAQEALLVKEGLRETRRHAAGSFESRFYQWLRESEDLAGRLENELRAERWGLAEAVVVELRQSCAQCHKNYRNH